MCCAASVSRPHSLPLAMSCVMASHPSERGAPWHSSRVRGNLSILSSNFMMFKRRFFVNYLVCLNHVYVVYIKRVTLAAKMLLRFSLDGRDSFAVTHIHTTLTPQITSKTCCVLVKREKTHLLIIEKNIQWSSI